MRTGLLAQGSYRPMRTGLAQRSKVPTNEVGPGKPDTNGEKTYSGGRDN
jgi:hypothetical protein